MDGSPTWQSGVGNRASTPGLRGGPTCDCKPAVSHVCRAMLPKNGTDQAMTCGDPEPTLIWRTRQWKLRGGGTYGGAAPSKEIQ